MATGSESERRDRRWFQSWGVWDRILSEWVYENGSPVSFTNYPVIDGYVKRCFGADQIRYLPCPIHLSPDGSARPPTADELLGLEGVK